MRGQLGPLAPIGMGKRFKHECTAIDEHGNKCENMEVIGGYCAFHHPSLVIERAEQKKRKTKPFIINHPLSKTYVPPKGEPRKERSINEIITNPRRSRHDQTSFPFGRNTDNPNDLEWPATDQEWADFERRYAVADDDKKPSKPKKTLPVGGYELIATIDPKFEGEKDPKYPKFYIPHMQYFVIRTKSGYRAVWLSHCGVGVKGQPPKHALFNHHWSKPHKTFDAAESEFSRGGESFWKIRDRIKNVKDPKWLPPNARKLAVAGAWETLKLTGADDKLIERLKAWKAAGCPGWRTWDGKASPQKYGSYTPTQYESQTSDHVQKWMKKHNWKQ